LTISTTCGREAKFSYHIATSPRAVLAPS
jgi:hypothetical protein